MEKALSRKIVAVNPNLLAHWCPACDGFHLVFINKPNGFDQVWFWNGDVETPTFRPNLGTPNHCHYRITSGDITYLQDSKHILAGKTFSMPDIPLDIPVMFNVSK
jgi:hypothetical protein